MASWSWPAGSYWWETGSAGERSGRGFVSQAPIGLGVVVSSSERQGRSTCQKGLPGCDDVDRATQLGRRYCRSQELRRV